MFIICDKIGSFFRIVDCMSFSFVECVDVLCC